MRRALGFKLRSQGVLLMGFVDYCEARGATTVTTDLAVAWARTTPRSSDPLWWGRRLLVVRVFARHLQALDGVAQVPACDILPIRFRRTTPYLFTDAEISALISAAQALTPYPRGVTWSTLLGLLAVTGLRIGEACRLDRDDVDLTDGMLTIRDSKFGKSRLVPLHATSTAALADYADLRDRHFPVPATAAFYLSTRGTRLDAGNTRHTFAALRAAAEIATPTGHRAPRIHDLRHTFATATLLGWYQTGADTQAKLPILSTWLGHADPKSTYWYLQAAPELLGLAADRLPRLEGEA
jgi:integrase/recombinase XerD